MYNVIVKKKVQKNIEKMPMDIKKLVVLLIDDLKEKGSILKIGIISVR